MALTFYHGHGSPYSWRIWLALEHMGVPYELKVLSFSDGDPKKPGFLALNPRGQVPTLVDDGFAVWESAVIPEYLEERFAAATGRTLFGTALQERTRVRRVVREIDAYLYAKGIQVIVEELFYAQPGHAVDLQRIATAKEVIEREAAGLVEALRGAFLGGAAPGMADFTLYPLVGYIGRIDVRKPGHYVGKLLPADLAAWKVRMEALPYFDKTYPPHWR